ncbi:MAG: DNA repair protein RecN [Thermoanaerobaculum sp.]|nr:DNA repair protein RecN [Thermoanaerobaculum sp.]MDW7968515.1 DNA repair protein RecN [Thermoanaerobaculum sp.]
MLRELEVRDLGIIEAVRLELPPGFVVLTGETGAGKSLLVHSLKLLSGERGDADMLRSGAERLFVEGVFSPLPEGLVKLLNELGVEAEGELVVRREMTANGRSRAWVNDVPVTLATLQRLAPSLLLIAGQHEQRTLTDPTTHFALVDAFGGLGALASEVEEAFSRWQQARQALAEARQRLAQRRDRLDLISFQLNELAAANMREGEQEALQEERTWLRHAERIGQLLAQARQALGDDGAVTQLARAVKAVRELAQVGVGVGETREQLEQAELLAEEALRVLDSLADRVRLDPRRLEEVESRLAVLERMARKYGGSVAAALAHQEALRREKESLEGVEDQVQELERAVEEASRSLSQLACELMEQRRKAACALARQVAEVLARLAMPGTKLELRQQLRLHPEGPLWWEGHRVNPAPWGLADGELYLSPNPGEPLKPLGKIASGGELSRIHLALRTVLRGANQRGDALTLLFDEVDAGVGGRVAEEVGRLLKALGERDQVLVVTHLPQVASAGDAHFVVTKTTRAGRTVTTVERVEGEERVTELVRLLGGGVDSPTVRQHARELLQRR